jgi:hypothetical protein
MRLKEEIMKKKYKEKFNPAKWHKRKKVITLYN